MSKGNCLYCGREFEKKPNKIFCSRRCKNAYHYEKNRNLLDVYDVYQAEFKKVCPTCGTEFITNSVFQVYCTPACRPKLKHGDTVKVRRLFKKKNTTPKKEVVKKTLDDYAKEADACGLSYGKFKAQLQLGKTFDELKAAYEKRKEFE